MTWFPALTAPFLTRENFPKDFIFGVGSSAFQVEGAADEGGRGKSIWDTLCDTNAKAEKSTTTANGTQEENASWLNYKKGSDHYHQFETDMRILKDLGVDSYRFSLSWSRILPNGRPGENNEGVNKEGVAFYNNLINAVKARGIEPFVTLFHWDLPQALQDEYGGFLNAKIREDYKNYADFCFKEFGDRIKFWATLNEPHMFANRGYVLGNHAPSQTDDPSRKPYTVVHHLLLSHADAYNLYKQKYKATQGGEVGITLDSLWYEGKDPNSKSDADAAERKLEFSTGWFMKPLTTGNYPDIMIKTLNDRLPKFEPDETELLVNSFDYIGVNYYTAARAFDQPQTNNEICKPSYSTDPRAGAEGYGKDCTSKWIKVNEEGLQKLLNWLNKHRDQIVFYVTENGVDRPSDSRKRLSYDVCKEDDMRIMYHHDHLKHILRAINENRVKVKGYFGWSFMDSFEWSNEDDHFGLYYVDYYHNFERHPKESAFWYKSFLQRGNDSRKRPRIEDGAADNS